MLFIITHTDENGERHQIGGAWSAFTAEEAIGLMLCEAGVDDDGKWNAYPVTDESEIIQ